MNKNLQDRYPADFDPAAHPIIAKHYYGIEPLRPIDQIATEAAANIRFRRQVEQLHKRRTA